MEWVAPWQIKYSKNQLMYIIFPYFEEMRRGYYPEQRLFQAQASGYTSPEYRVFRIKPVAPYQPAVEIVAEVSDRLKMVANGQLLIDTFTYLLPEKELRKRYNLDNWTLPQETNSILQYISGINRKRTTYKQWLVDREYDKTRRKSKNIVDSKTAENKKE